MKSRQHRYWVDLKHPRTFSELVSNVAVEVTDDIIWDTLSLRMEELVKWLEERGVPGEIISAIDGVILETVSEVVQIGARAGYGLATTPLTCNSFVDWANAATEKAGLLNYETDITFHAIQRKS